MIIDKIENIEIYKNIPHEAINFIKSLNTNSDTGRYNISDMIYANIEEYQTKNIEDAKFESHNKYIDIQLLIAGREDIFITDFSGLSILRPYNENSDITFYSDPVNNHLKYTLNGSNFVMLLPHEAHAPQISSEGLSSRVKKVVVKVKV